MRAVDPRIRAVFLADGCGSGKSQKATARAACAHSQSAARSLGVSTRGAASGAPVSASKNGFGRASPRHHQPRIADARRAESSNEAGGGASRGNGPLAEPA